ncbi:STAS domain-containing protein [Candidatus Phycosocius spiralis]|uniref:Chemotaxis protein CheX n=1 Tax=Candidatus Phycosocius spiralis TaxID=2815099 RepID=A0ABQ4PXV4_9PROT|nr:STAS domain-containing protein [Candidatus Phycosocius spiralis]GIU67776.1 chemotaxis protein CheX [Candidatus Phycosocius spiralis]
MTHFTLPTTLDTRAAPDLLEALRAHQGQDLILDASKVDSLGGLCLQILLAAKAEWGSSPFHFSVENPTPVFCEQMGAFGAAIEEFCLQGAAQ